MGEGHQASDADVLLDQQFIVHEAARQPGVDARRIALIGHSLGAQRSLGAAVENPAIDAVVSLDTTWDYAINREILGGDEERARFARGAADSYRYQAEQALAQLGAGG